MLGLFIFATGLVKSNIESLMLKSFTALLTSLSFCYCSIFFNFLKKFLKFLPNKKYQTYTRILSCTVHSYKDNSYYALLRRHLRGSVSIVLNVSKKGIEISGSKVSPLVPNVSKVC